MSEWTKCIMPEAIKKYRSELRCEADKIVRMFYESSDECWENEFQEDQINRAHAAYRNSAVASKLPVKISRQGTKLYIYRTDR